MNPQIVNSPPGSGRELLEKALQDSLSKGEIFRVDNASYPDLEHLVSIAQRQELKFTFNTRRKSFRALMPVPMHACGSSWLSGWVHEIRNLKLFEKYTIANFAEIDVEGFTGQYQNSIKTPDTSLVVRGLAFPTIAIEVGYTETMSDLMDDVDLLLEGSEAQIAHVIVIKMQPLRDNENEIESAFVQVYQFDEQSGSKVRKGGRKTLIPTPKSHVTQRLDFSWQDVLGERAAELIPPNSPNPPPLMLDDLRELIALSTSYRILNKPTAGSRRSARLSRRTG